MAQQMLNVTGAALRSLMRKDRNDDDSSENQTGAESTDNRNDADDDDVRSDGTDSLADESADVDVELDNDDIDERENLINNVPNKSDAEDEADDDIDDDDVTGADYGLDNDDSDTDAGKMVIDESGDDITPQKTGIKTEVEDEGDKYLDPKADTISNTGVSDLDQMSNIVENIEKVPIESDDITTVKQEVTETQPLDSNQSPSQDDLLKSPTSSDPQSSQVSTQESPNDVNKSKKKEHIPDPSDESVSRKRPAQDEFDTPPSKKPYFQQNHEDFEEDVDNPDYKIFQEPFYHGWRREIVFRAIYDRVTVSGKEKNKPQSDIYYFNPDGKKLRSAVQIADYLKIIDTPLTSDNFTFRKFRVYKDPQESLRTAGIQKNRTSNTSSPRAADSPKVTSATKVTPGTPVTTPVYQKRGRPKKATKDFEFKISLHTPGSALSGNTIDMNLSADTSLNESGNLDESLNTTIDESINSSTGLTSKRVASPIVDATNSSIGTRQTTRRVRKVPSERRDTEWLPENEMKNKKSTTVEESIEIIDSVIEYRQKSAKVKVTPTLAEKLSKKSIERSKSIVDAAVKRQQNSSVLVKFPMKRPAILGGKHHPSSFAVNQAGERISSVSLALPPPPVKINAPSFFTMTFRTPLNFFAVNQAGERITNVSLALPPPPVKINAPSFFTMTFRTPLKNVSKPCDLKCPDMEGVEPDLQCSACMCLFHTQCVDFMDSAGTVFVCHKCKGTIGTDSISGMLGGTDQMKAYRLDVPPTTASSQAPKSWHMPATQPIAPPSIQASGLGQPNTQPFGSAPPSGFAPPSATGPAVRHPVTLLGKHLLLPGNQPISTNIINQPRIPANNPLSYSQSPMGVAPRSGFTIGNQHIGQLSTVVPPPSQSVILTTATKSSVVSITPPPLTMGARTPSVPLTAPQMPCPPRLTPAPPRLTHAPMLLLPADHNTGAPPSSITNTPNFMAPPALILRPQSGDTLLTSKHNLPLNIQPAIFNPTSSTTTAVSQPGTQQSGLPTSKHTLPLNLKPAIFNATSTTTAVSQRIQQSGLPATAKQADSTPTTTPLTALQNTVNDAIPASQQTAQCTPKTSASTYTMPVTKNTPAQVLTLPQNLSNQIDMKQSLYLKVNNTQIVIPPSCILKTPQGVKVCVPGKTFDTGAAGSKLICTTMTGEGTLPQNNMKLVISTTDAVKKTTATTPQSSTTTPQTTAPQTTTAPQSTTQRTTTLASIAVRPTAPQCTTPQTTTPQITTPQTTTPQSAFTSTLPTWITPNLKTSLLNKQNKSEYARYNPRDITEYARNNPSQLNDIGEELLQYRWGKSPASSYGPGKRPYPWVTRQGKSIKRHAVNPGLSFMKTLYSGDDIMAQIFRYLNPATLLRCARVCRSWSRIATSSRLWEHVNFGGVHITDWNHAQLHLTNAHTKHLSFRDIRLGHDIHTMYENMSELIQSLNSNVQLRTLDLGLVPSYVLQPCCGLTVLRAHIERSVLTILDMRKLMTMPRLRVLELTKSPAGPITTDIPVKCLDTMLESLTELKSVSLIGLKLNVKQVETMSQLSKLTHLTLTDTTEWTDSTYRSLTECSNLQHLHLECGTSSDTVFPSLLPRFKRLKRLELLEYTVDPEFTRSLPKVQSLTHLKLWPHIGDEPAKVNITILRIALSLESVDTFEWGVLPFREIGNGPPKPHMIPLLSGDSEDPDSMYVSIASIYNYIRKSLPRANIQVYNVIHGIGEDNEYNRFALLRKSNLVTPDPDTGNASDSASEVGSDNEEVQMVIGESGMVSKTVVKRGTVVAISSDEDDDVGDDSFVGGKNSRASSEKDAEMDVVEVDDDNDNKMEVDGKSPTKDDKSVDSDDITNNKAIDACSADATQNNIDDNFSKETTDNMLDSDMKEVIKVMDDIKNQLDGGEKLVTSPEKMNCDDGNYVKTEIVDDALTGKNTCKSSENIPDKLSPTSHLNDEKCDGETSENKSTENQNKIGSAELSKANIQENTVPVKRSKSGLKVPRKKKFTGVKIKSEPVGDSCEKTTKPKDEDEKMEGNDFLGGLSKNDDSSAFSLQIDREMAKYAAARNYTDTPVTYPPKIKVGPIREQSPKLAETDKCLETKTSVTTQKDSDNDSDVEMVSCDCDSDLELRCHGNEDVAMETGDVDEESNDSKVSVGGSDGEGKNDKENQDSDEESDKVEDEKPESEPESDKNDYDSDKNESKRERKVDSEMESDRSDNDSASDKSESDYERNESKKVESGDSNSDQDDSDRDSSNQSNADSDSDRNHSYKKPKKTKGKKDSDSDYVPDYYGEICGHDYSLSGKKRTKKTKTVRDKENISVGRNRSMNQNRPLVQNRSTTVNRFTTEKLKERYTKEKLSESDEILRDVTAALESIVSQIAGDKPNTTAYTTTANTSSMSYNRKIFGLKPNEQKNKGTRVADSLLEIDDKTLEANLDESMLYDSDDDADGGSMVGDAILDSDPEDNNVDTSLDGLNTHKAGVTPDSANVVSMVADSRIDDIPHSAKITSANIPNTAIRQNTPIVSDMPNTTRPSTDLPGLHANTEKIKTIIESDHLYVARSMVEMAGGDVFKSTDSTRDTNVANHNVTESGDITIHGHSSDLGPTSKDDVDNIVRKISPHEHAHSYAKSVRSDAYSNTSDIVASSETTMKSYRTLPQDILAVNSNRDINNRNVLLEKQPPTASSGVYSGNANIRYSRVDIPDRKSLDRNDWLDSINKHSDLSKKISLANATDNLTSPYNVSLLGKTKAYGIASAGASSGASQSYKDNETSRSNSPFDSSSKNKGKGKKTDNNNEAKTKKKETKKEEPENDEVLQVKLDVSWNTDLF